MNRYLKTLRLFWTTSLSAEMEYRSNFVLACITAAGNLAGSILAVWVFFRYQDRLGGYRYDHALLVMGFFMVLVGLSNTVFRQNLSRIVLHVRNGTLDFVLLKPIDAQFWLSTRNCSPWGIPNVILGLSVVFYAGNNCGLMIANYLYGAVALGCGMVMLYSLWFMLGSLSIWFVKVHNITHVLYQMLESGRYPVTAYGHIYRVFLTFVIPIAFLTTFPMEVMTGGTQFKQFIGLSHAQTLMFSASLAVGLLIFSRIFWSFALRFYTSASS